MYGFVPPRIHPLMGYTFEPREMVIDAWINITTINKQDNVILKSGLLNYKTEYYYYEKDGSRVGPLEFEAKVFVQPLDKKFYEVTVVGTEYRTIQNL